MGIKESNAGGTSADALARLGISALVIEEQASEGELWTLQIDSNANITLHDAQQYKGKYTYALSEELFEQFGPGNAILCIGPAGEQGLKSASIQGTDVITGLVVPPVAAAWAP